MKKDFPEVTPVRNPAYKIVQEKLDGYSYVSIDGMVIIQSWEIASDGNLWIHTSFSRKNRIPEYKDMKRIREAFIGPDKPAYMVFPMEQNHVNIHPFCLHFFTPVYDGTLPEFSQGGML
jgi:hypothetical protein